MKAESLSLSFLSVDILHSGQYQPRTNFDENSLKELAESIKAQGIIEPLIVRKLSDTYYEIIAGERRWRAAKLARLDKVPCIVGEYQDIDVAAIALVENIQRQDLNPIEEAKGMQRLMMEFGFTQELIGQMIGKSRPHVSNLLRLLTLDEPVQLALINQQLSMGHVRALVGLDKYTQRHFMSEAITHMWSVRVLEKKIKDSFSQKNSKKTTVSNTHLTDSLSQQLGYPVEIEQKDESNSGWLKIKYFDNETFEGLLIRLGLRYD